METDYNFWRDLLDTYQSLPDWLKFCWLFIPAALLTLAGHGLTRLARELVSGRLRPAEPIPMHNGVEKQVVPYLEHSEVMGRLTADRERDVGGD